MAFVGKKPKFDSVVLKDNTTASVSNPPSGSSEILVRNGSLYVKDSSGNESVAGGGAGELNLINDTITASNWVASGAGITVATSSTASELPLSPVVDTGIKITPVSSTDYVRYRFTLPEALYNTKLKLAWYQESLSGYATGDLKVEMYTNSQSDYAGSYVELALSTDSSGTSSIPNLKGQFVTTFDTNSVQYLELRIIRTAGTTALVLQNIVVGPGLTQQSAVITPWTSYTPTASNFTIGNGTQEWFYRRVGTTIEVAGKVILGSTSSVSSVPSFSIPSGLTFDALTLASGNGEYTNLGECNVLDTSGSATYSGAIYQNLTSSTLFYGSSQGNTSFSSTVPFTWATGDWMTFNLKAPISEWAGSGVVNLAQNDVEYAYATGTWDASSSTTAYGPSGVATGGALTAAVVKTVTWQTPISPTDQITIELSPDQVTWMDFASSAPYTLNSTGSNDSSGGIYLSSATSTTTAVGFARYKAIGNDDTPAVDWPSSGLYWRVKKTRGGVATGFSEATDAVNGLVKKPRIQQKLLGSDVTAASTDVIAFNNLTIGRVYKISYMLQIISSGASHVGLVNITDGTTTFTRVGCTSLASGENQHVGGSYYVTAATTVLKLRTISAWNNSTLAATSGGQQISWALIEEINDYSVTTDFT